MSEADLQSGCVHRRELTIPVNASFHLKGREKGANPGFTQTPIVSAFERFGDLLETFAGRVSRCGRLCNALHSQTAASATTAPPAGVMIPTIGRRLKEFRP
jgi:hypothetical protein